MSNLNTAHIIVLGLIGAILINLPFYSWLEGGVWSWMDGFPLGWCGRGLTYMVTFFHEIGHTVFLWFYGYATLPSFDLQHGGGMAWYFGKQNKIIIAALYAAIGYGLYIFKDHKALQVGIITIFIFHLLTAYNQNIYMNIINFMGPAFQPLIGGFFLCRAWMDLAPRGDLERFLNALIGFGICFNTFIEGFSLLNNPAYRDHYYKQKGTIGFGDFDKIAGSFNFISFNGIVGLWLFLAFVALFVPIIIYLYTRVLNYEDI